MQKIPNYKRKYLSQRCDYSLELPNLSQCPESIIVIPAYNESINDIEPCLLSIGRSATASQHNTLVLVLINYSETDKSEIKISSENLYKQLLSKKKLWTSTNLDVRTYIQKVSQKERGVGWARKKLMDLAYRIYDSYDSEGIIVNLDADCTVERNYITTINRYFRSHPDVEAVSIAFSHPIQTDSPETTAIIQYELHLRYFINMQRLISLPYAYQTIGSAMAVRSESYAKVGGMNKRQAGEDFYFLHKYTKRESLGDMVGTTVIASHRRSERVPFGTGRAVGLILDHENDNYSTYNPESFEVILEFVRYGLGILLEVEEYIVIDNQPIRSKIKELAALFELDQNIEQIKQRTQNKEDRKKVFFTWYDAFKLMKSLHHLRDHYYPNVSVSEAIEHLFDRLDIGYNADEDLSDFLIKMREYDYDVSYKERTN